MSSVAKLLPGIIASAFAAIVLPTSDALAQHRLVFNVSAEDAKYVQQHSMDVGDTSGHQVRLFEIHRAYPGNAPVVNGMKIVESWTRGISDYTSNNGEGTVYAVYLLENGDRFFTRGSLIATQSPEANNLKAVTVGPITGGTGKLAGIRGMARTLASANPKEGMVETQVDIEYWLP
jgi:hypothetical protein